SAREPMGLTRWARIESRARDEVGPAQIPSTTKAALVAMLVFLFAVTVITHQLTPVFLLVWMGAMVVTGRVVGRGVLVVWALLGAYLFALPFLALITALGLSVRPRPRPWIMNDELESWNEFGYRWTAKAVPLALLALLGSITVRYGNESFEQVRPADLHAVQ